MTALEGNHTVYRLLFNINTAQMMGVYWRTYKNEANSSSVIQDDFIEIVHNDYDTYVLNPWTWLQAKSNIPVYVYIITVLAAIVCVINSIAIFIFVKERMLSTNNILLIAIALSDTLYILIPVPFLLLTYTSSSGPYIPLHLCRLWDYFTKTIPTIAHTSSIWLTMCLCVHRYICVCHPFRVKRYISRRRCIKTIILVYLISTCFHFCRFVDTRYTAMKITLGEQVIRTCQGIHESWLNGVEVEYECSYYWFYITFIIIFPFSVLIVLSIVIIHKMRVSESIRYRATSSSSAFCHLTDVNKRSKHKKSLQMTKLIVGIIAIVIIVEVPIGVILILWTLSMIHKQIFMSEQTLSSVSIVLMLLLYVSYTIIFILYCAMCSRFRSAVKRLFCRGGNSTNMAVQTLERSEQNEITK